MFSNRGLAILFSTVVLVVVIISFLFVLRGENNQTNNNTRKESILSVYIPHSRGIKYNLQDYGDYMKTSQKQILEIAKDIRKSEIKLPEAIIVSQLIVGYSTRDKVYYLDLLTSIQMNLLNPSVSEYHLLQVDDAYNSEIMSLMHADKKIKIHYINEQINREIFVKYCNENLKDRIVIYLNQPDVYFDHSLMHASKLKNGEFAKIHKRISVAKPYDCDDGQGTIPDGVIFRTSSDKPFALGTEPDWNGHSIISMIFDSFTVSNCEVSTAISGWFLHDPTNIDKKAEKEAELKELERQKQEKIRQEKLEKERKLKEEEEKRKKLEEEKRLKEEQLKKEKEEKERKQKEEQERKLKEEQEKKKLEEEKKQKEEQEKLENERKLEEEKRLKEEQLKKEKEEQERKLKEEEEKKQKEEQEKLANERKLKEEQEQKKLEEEKKLKEEAEKKKQQENQPPTNSSITTETSNST